MRGLPNTTEMKGRLKPRALFGLSGPFDMPRNSLQEGQRRRFLSVLLIGGVIFLLVFIYAKANLTMYDSSAVGPWSVDNVFRSHLQACVSCIIHKPPCHLELNGIDSALLRDIFGFNAKRQHHHWTREKPALTNITSS